MDPECERTIGQIIRRLMSSQTIQCTQRRTAERLNGSPWRSRSTQREKRSVFVVISFKIGTTMTDYQNGRIHWIWKIAEMNGTDSRTEQQCQCVASRGTHGHWSDHQEDGQFGNESISVSVNSCTFYFERTAEQIKVSWPKSENKSVRGLFQSKWGQQWRSEGEEHRVCTVKWSRNEHQEVKWHSHGYRGTLSRSSLIILSVFGLIPFAADIISGLWLLRLPEITCVFPASSCVGDIVIKRRIISSQWM